MIPNDEMSLRPPALGMVQVGFRLPAEAVAYYEGEAASSGRSKVDVVVNALFLDRDLGRRLAPFKVELEAAAKSMNLDLRLDLAEVLSKLIERGLRVTPTDLGDAQVEYVARGQKK